MSAGEHAAAAPAPAAAPDPATAARSAGPGALPPAGRAEPDGQAPALRAGLARGTGRLLASELALVFRRPRNIVLLAVLACAPVLLGIAVRLSSPGPGDGGGPPFLNQVSHNGVFLALFALFVTLPLFLPLAVAVVAGDSVAGETAAGTLRVLLTVPAGRGRLLLVKFVAVALFCLAVCAVVAASGLLLGAALFGAGPVTLLSGDSVSLAAGMLRVLWVVGYLTAALTTLSVIGIAISTFTRHALAVMAAILVLAVGSEIADAVPQFGPIRPFLPTHFWMSFDALVRSPVGWTQVAHGLASFAIYAVIFYAVAWARITTCDVSC
jgi:ABC-2 type transport system permease protein